MNSNPYQKYEQNAINTTPPGELTLMLYNGCLKFIKQGKEALSSGQIEDKNISIQKAQRIIQELMITLDQSIPISKEFLAMYDFISNQLMIANTKNNIKALEVAEEFVKEFRDTWKEVIQINRQQSHRNVGQA